MKNRLFPLLVAALAALAFAGCNTNPFPDPYDIRVSLSDDLRGASIQVDAIGIPNGELSKFRTKSVTDYWKPGDDDRVLATKKTLVFTRDTGLTQSIPSDDPLWNRWIQQYEAQYMVFLVDLPGLSQDMEGNADKRRLIIPLDKKLWEERPSVINVTVSMNGVSSNPVPMESY